MSILILGDEERAVYHPLSRVRTALQKILGMQDKVYVETEYHRMTIRDLKQYAVIVSYIDAYRNMGSFADALADYICDGGKVLALHNGIISPAQSRLELMLGGNFVTHPSRRLLQFHMDEDVRLLQQEESFADFKLFEEPYVVRQTDDRNHVFLSFRNDGQDYPAGWIRRSGKGTVMYLAPGHDGEAFRNTVFCRILSMCINRLLHAGEVAAHERENDYS